MLDNLLKTLTGAAMGQKSDNYSRKWVVVAAGAAIAYFHPAFVMPSWLLQIVSVWIGAQGAADVAAVFKPKA